MNEAEGLSSRHVVMLRCITPPTTAGFRDNERTSAISSAAFREAVHAHHATGSASL
jgi:hypothetical protein